MLTGTIPSDLYALTRLGVLCVPHCVPVLPSVRTVLLGMRSGFNVAW
jgi:hypothetical protein